MKTWEQARALAKCIKAGKVTANDPELPIPFSHVEAGRWLAEFVLEQEQVETRVSTSHLTEEIAYFNEHIGTWLRDWPDMRGHSLSGA